MKYFTLICLLLFLSCNKEDEFIDIVLSVKLIDENGYFVDDHSGIEITLKRGSEIIHGKTDSHGECVFNKFPYGIFNMELEKSGYISGETSPIFTNHSSDSLYTYSYYMVEIPQYTISIDSISKEAYDRLFGYGTLHNTKGIPEVWYHLEAYISDNEYVSKDNYTSRHLTTLMGMKIEGNSCEFGISTRAYGPRIPPEADTLYVRLYPCANYDEFYEIREEALGTPSDVFKWIVPD